MPDEMSRSPAVADCLVGKRVLPRRETDRWSILASICIRSTARFVAWRQAGR